MSLRAGVDLDAMEKRAIGNQCVNSFISTTASAAPTKRHPAATQHRTSAMEFPYSVAGLTPDRLHMRWPNIAEPHAPDKPGARFHRQFGAVPVVLNLHYPVTA